MKVSADRNSRTALRLAAADRRSGQQVFYAVCCFILLISTSCQNNQQKEGSQRQDLIIFHAGSLSIPFLQLEKEFEKLYPHINVVREAAGSITCARKITDLHRDCDIIASADYAVIEDFLIPAYVDKAIPFATNEMVIMYRDNSIFAEKITAHNWYEILGDENVKYGRSDPHSDPCGYRTLICMKLAKKYYQDFGISKDLTQKDKRYIRPKASDLIALLEIGELDYVFEYKSVAKQFGFSYVALPDSINLSDNELNDHYKTVSIEINGKKPREKIVVSGKAMIYGIAPIKKSLHSENIKLFLDFLFSETGRKIIELNGQKFL